MRKRKTPDLAAGRKRLRRTALLLLPLAVFLLGATYAWFTYEESETNRLSLGDVEAVLEEPEWSKNGGKDGEDMEPGDTVIKDPLVTAAAGEMYFRLVLTIHEIDAAGQAGSPITDEERLDYILRTLYQDSGYPDTPYLDTAGSYHGNDLLDMVLKDEISSVTDPAGFTLNRRESGAGVYYYYYTANQGIFRAASAADGREADSRYFMTHIVVPSEWQDEELDILGSYGITFQVQAIQADAFTSMEEAHAALPGAIAAQAAEDHADQPGTPGE